MNFAWSKKKSDKPVSRKSPEETIQWFEKEIARNEDLLYGIALFFEGVCLLFAGQEDVIETYRKQFRNIIQTGKNTSQQASALLEQVRQDPSQSALLTEFSFSLCDGHPDPQGMLKRAEALVLAYRRLFPDRPRSQSFTEEETFKLMEEAGEELAKAGAK